MPGGAGPGVHRSPLTERYSHFICYTALSWVVMDIDIHESNNEARFLRRELTANQSGLRSRADEDRDCHD